MPRKIASRRVEPRVDLAEEVGATVELRDANGRRHKLRLTQLSVGGCSFHMPGPIAGLQNGAMLSDVKLCAAKMEILGNVEVRHLTGGFGSDYSCGVRFYAASDEDRNRLITLFSRLEALGRMES